MLMQRCAAARPSPVGPGGQHRPRPRTPPALQSHATSAEVPPAVHTTHTHALNPPTPTPPTPHTAAVKVHRNFKEALTIKVAFTAEAIYGGQLLGVKGQDFVVFYDWATGKVRALDACLGKMGCWFKGKRPLSEGKTARE